MNQDIYIRTILNHTTEKAKFFV